MAYLRSIWSQSFPPPPIFDQTDIPKDQQGRVFIVTGGSSGVGLELTKMLYPTGATIYIACPSEEEAQQAMQDVIVSTRHLNDKTSGILRFLSLDLNDLSTIKRSTSAFAAQESRLDILWNNAGIFGSPIGKSTAQNIEAHTGVNCVGPFLLTQELLPLMRETAKVSPCSTVPIIWTASLIAEIYSPRGGIDFSLLDSGATRQAKRDYAMSKVGNWWLAVEGARRYGSCGVMSIALNPGNVATNIWKHQPWWLMMVVRRVLHDPKLGAHTALYAGFSSDLRIDENNGTYVLPWGRIRGAESGVRKDIVQAMESGAPARFWSWCEDQCRK